MFENRVSFDCKKREENENHLNTTTQIKIKMFSWFVCVFEMSTNKTEKDCVSVELTEDLFSINFRGIFIFSNSTLWSFWIGYSKYFTYSELNPKKRVYTRARSHTTFENGPNLHLHHGISRCCLVHIAENGITKC